MGWLLDDKNNETRHDMKTEYQVIVGNIGTVHDSNNPVDANKVYGDYKRQSEDGYGRASGESVTLLVDGEIRFEHLGERASFD